jgi:CRISPR-associated protein Cmr4
MTQEKRTLFLYCEESLHMGAGSSTGTIDLPIQRERHTNFPKIESSSLRGAIREASYDLSLGEDVQKADFERIYGEKMDGRIHSAVDFTDARILFFPVRSYKGVFAWITCPLVLERLERDFQKMHNHKLELTDYEHCDDNLAFVQKKSKISIDGKVVFEEYVFSATPKKIKVDNMGIGKWIYKIFNNKNPIINKLKTNIAIVSNEVFRDFVELYTHKITRNKICSKTGTADEGGLFNEEFLPPESILYSFITASNEFRKDDERLTATEIMKFVEKHLPKLFRGGGDKGIGKGLIRQSIKPYLEKPDTKALTNQKTT